MCRHETATYACGHKQDLGFFCDYAKSYGPLFNKVNCPNYSHGAEKFDTFNQCGKQRGFYCAKSQDGVVIDKAKDAQSTANFQLNIKKSEFQRIALSCSNYLQEAKMREVPNEELVKLPHYCKLEQQRQLVGSHCTILRNRSIYFQNLLNYAFGKRNMLAPGVCHYPEWDLVSFDFDHSIFSLSMLQPIRHLLPCLIPPPMTPAGPHIQNTMNQYPGQVPPSMTPSGSHSQNTTTQYPGQVESTNNEALVGPSPGATPAPQAKSVQRPKLKVKTMPTKQTIVTEEGSPMSSEIVRGKSPEGEDMMAKAARYRAQLTDSRKKVVTGAMIGAGYDLGSNGIRPPAKQTPTKDESPVAFDSNNSIPTPKKVRRSTRTRNTKTNYAEGSDNSLGSDAASPFKPDSAWNDSPSRSDPAWVDTPTKSVGSSSSPIRPTRARSNRTTQRFTGSPNDSPSQALLSSRISEYQKCNGNVVPGGTTHATAAATQFGNLFQPSTRTSQMEVQLLSADSHQVPSADTAYSQNVQTSHEPDSINLHGQNDLMSGRTFSNMNYAQGMLQSTHTPQQRTAAMQRGSYLIQELGHSLHEYQTASGMISTGAANVTQSPQDQQYATSSSMMFAPQAQMMSAVPQLGSPETDLPINGSSGSPMNFFHHNLNQARAAGPTLPSQGRSFSTGSVPLSNLQRQPVVGNPLSPSHHVLHQHTPIRADYGNMRRSFSSAANLTPQQLLLSPHPTSGPEPLKRSLPPASPTLGRKRNRLSFPGESDAPTLTPSQSKHQLYAPAGLPASNNIDFAAEIAAIEMFEKQNMAELAALRTATSNIDPRLHPADDSPHSAVALPNTDLQADQSIPVDPQLHEDSSASTYVQPTEANLVDPSAQITEQSGTHPPHAPTTPARGFLNDSSSPLSEPDWSLVNDDAFQ
ncbi:hypothetical protein MBLNU13_g07634t1 [Cladosporium sp. NU13]